MKIVAFVPIKLNNQRLPNKNILPLNGYPLCWHIFDTLLKVKKEGKIDDIYVFCSDEKITEYIPKDIIFLKRDTVLDGNLTIGMDIYTAFKNTINADIYVLCHATSPFINQTSIITGIDAVKSGKYDSSFPCEKLQTFAWFKNKPINYGLEHIPRTQDLEPIFVETSSFYIFTKSIINSGKRIGNKPKIIVIDKVEGIDIDYQEDYDFACLIGK